MFPGSCIKILNCTLEAPNPPLHTPSSLQGPEFPLHTPHSPSTDPNFPPPRPGSPFQIPVSPLPAPTFPPRPRIPPSMPQIPPHRPQYAWIPSPGPISPPFRPRILSHSPPRGSPSHSRIPGPLRPAAHPRIPDVHGCRGTGSSPGSGLAVALPLLKSRFRRKNTPQPIRAKIAERPRPQLNSDSLDPPAPRFMDRRTSQSVSKMSGRLRPRRCYSQPIRNDQIQLSSFTRIQSAPGNSQSQPRIRNRAFPPTLPLNRSSRPSELTAARANGKREEAEPSRVHTFYCGR